MPVNQVFANGLEIACKAAEGKSVAAFPDPCWSPPPPSAGPIVIPYPNTAYAKDLAKCSTSVFISGKPVAKRDESYISTSTGNEAATKQFAQGVVSGTIKGKAYFRSWSMNVKIEGKNVTRHTDKMTHNHNPATGNTGPWTYIDGSAKKSDCKREFEKVEQECGGQKKVKKPGSRKKKWVDVGKKVKWKTRNCLGLNLKPRSIDKSKLDDFLKETEGKLDDLNLYDAAITKAKELALQKAEEILLKMVGKAVAKKIIGAAAGPVGWIVTAVDSAADALEVAELKEHIDAVNAEARRIQEELGTLQEKLKNIPKQIKRGETGPAAKTVAETQRLIATANPCTRARKCMLVSYKSTEKRSGGLDSLGGCCGGQTGHHMIPDSYMNGTSICSGYSHGGAPTVCAEGANQYDGSHGAIHTNTEIHVRKDVTSSQKITYKNARDAAIKAHRDTFPMSFCSSDCLKEQLDNYYQNKACKNKAGYIRSANPWLNYKKIGNLPSDKKHGNNTTL